MVQQQVDQSLVGLGAFSCDVRLKMEVADTKAEAQCCRCSRGARNLHRLQGYAPEVAFLEASLLPFPFSTAVKSGNTEALADSMIPVSFRLLPSLSKTTVYFPEQSCTMSRTIVLTDGTTV